MFPGKVHGFSLAEMVAVLLITAVLASAAFPYFSRKDHVAFEGAAFAEAAEAMLRYGQQVAVAGRRDVYVNMDATSRQISLRFESSGGVPVLRPEGDVPLERQCNTAVPRWYCEKGSADITLSGAPVSAVFDAQGRASASLSLLIDSGDYRRTITIESGTGYVHH